jgi:hypothetical protein
MFTISMSSSDRRIVVALVPLASARRQTNPGEASAAAFTGASAATKSASSGLSSGASIRARLSWARCTSEA